MERIRGWHRPEHLSTVIVVVVALLVGIGAAAVLTRDRSPQVSTESGIGAAPSKSPTRAIRAVFFGDALVAGAEAGAGNLSFADVTARTLNWRSSSFGYPGSGFTTAGTFKGGRDYLARVEQLRGYEVDVVVLEGGLNDGNADEQLLSEKASAVIERIKQLVPGVQIVLMGPWSFRGTPLPTVVKTRNTLRQVAINEGIPFVDPVGEQWITGERSRKGNASLYISDSGLYPNTRGHAYFGQRLAQRLRELLPARFLPAT